jgi:ribonucleoside-diphosphate reductase alpha chain
MAWKKGVKSLYYCRSTSIQRAEKVSHKVPDATQLSLNLEPAEQQTLYANTKYEECLACQ